MPIIWGAGLTTVLQSLPSLILPPLLVTTLPTILARSLPPEASLDAVQAFLDLSASLRALLSLIVYVIAKRAVGDLMRRIDRRRLGPDVVEVPRMKMRWPGNLDFIPHIMHNRKTGEPFLQATRRGWADNRRKIMSEGLGSRFLSSMETYLMLGYSEGIRCVLV